MTDGQRLGGGDQPYSSHASMSSSLAQADRYARCCSEQRSSAVMSVEPAPDRKLVSVPDGDSSGSKLAKHPA